MRTIKLEFKNIETLRALHIYLQYKLDFPAYYGRNLDALYDCLTGIDEDTRITLAPGDACGECAAGMSKLLRVLENAQEENPHLTIVTI